MESKLDDALANETPESIHKWLESKLGPIRSYHSEKLEKILKEIEEDEYVEKLAEKYYGPGDYGLESKQGFIKGYDKAKQTLYTEEQVRKAIDMARCRAEHIFWYNDDEIIQSLKQPKQ